MMFYAWLVIPIHCSCWNFHHHKHDFELEAWSTEGCKSIKSKASTSLADLVPLETAQLLPFVPVPVKHRIYQFDQESTPHISLSQSTSASFQRMCIVQSFVARPGQASSVRNGAVAETTLQQKA